MSYPNITEIEDFLMDRDLNKESHSRLESQIREDEILAGIAIEIIKNRTKIELPAVNHDISFEDCLEFISREVNSKIDEAVVSNACLSILKLLSNSIERNQTLDIFTDLIENESFLIQINALKALICLSRKNTLPKKIIKKLKKIFLDSNLDDSIRTYALMAIHSENSDESIKTICRENILDESKSHLLKHAAIRFLGGIEGLDPIIYSLVINDNEFDWQERAVAIEVSGKSDLFRRELLKLREEATHAAIKVAINQLNLVDVEGMLSTVAEEISEEIIEEIPSALSDPEFEKYLNGRTGIQHEN